MKTGNFRVALPNIHMYITGMGRRSVTKKLVLWSVLVLQLCLIGCIWLLQIDYSQEQNTLGKVSSRVHFVTSKDSDLNITPGKGSPGGGIHCPRRQDNVNRYEADFYRMKPAVLNETNPPDYNVPAYVQDAEMGLTENLWCYREGTLNESHQMNYIDYLMVSPHCDCASGWHGRDCGQPEIIWRALMTHSGASKRGGTTPIQLVEASSNYLHRLFYMLDLGVWEHISLELLELQIQSLLKVVDYFLIYYVSNTTKKRNIKNVMGSQTNYVLLHCSSATTCTSSSAYSYFRRQLWLQCSVQMQPHDLLLHGDSQTVYAPAALKFLKYYAGDVLPLRFRVKYNVYGLYWQHPNKTLLSGVISSLGHLHSVHANINRLQRQAGSTLGDLNHYGGWSCELCLSPDQIILRLQSSHQPQLSVRLPNDTRNAHIDATYIQKLIGNGVHMDSFTQLLRLREQSEKYFAPKEALQHSSRYGQLLVNLYDVNVLEDLQDED